MYHIKLGGDLVKSVAVKQTKDQIADIIRGDILSGVLKGDDELTQEQVAEQTGLSRMPVREAFQTLEQEGFLVRLPNRHMRVIQITKETIRQYFDTLVAIEASFFKQLLKDGRETAAIEDALVHATNSGSAASEYDAHLALVAALSNEYLRGIHTKLLDSFYRHGLEQFWKKDAAASSLQTTLAALRQRNVAAIEDGLAAYFALYKGSMMKGREA